MRTRPPPHLPLLPGDGSLTDLDRFLAVRWRRLRRTASRRPGAETSDIKEEGRGSPARRGTREAGCVRGRPGGQGVRATHVSGASEDGSLTDLDRFLAVRWRRLRRTASRRPGAETSDIKEEGRGSPARRGTREAGMRARPSWRSGCTDRYEAGGKGEPSPARGPWRRRFKQSGGAGRFSGCGGAGRLSGCGGAVERVRGSGVRGCGGGRLGGGRGRWRRGPCLRLPRPWGEGRSPSCRGRRSPRGSAGGPRRRR